MAGVTEQTKCIERGCEGKSLRGSHWCFLHKFGVAEEHFKSVGVSIKFIEDWRSGRVQGPFVAKDAQMWDWVAYGNGDYVHPKILKPY